MVIQGMFFGNLPFAEFLEKVIRFENRVRINVIAARCHSVRWDIEGQVVGDERYAWDNLTFYQAA